MAGTLTQNERRMHRTSDFRDIELEYKFVGGIVTNLEAFNRVMPTFDSDAITSDRIKKIYDIAIKVFLDTEQRLTVNSLRHSLNVKEERVEAYGKCYGKCKRKGGKATLADTLTASKKLEQLFKGRMVELEMKGVITDLGKAISGQLESVDQAVRKIDRLAVKVASRKIATQVTDPVETYPDWKKDFRNIQKHPELIEAIDTGIEDIDKHMRGIRKGELAILISLSGIGKSIGLMNVCTHCWRTTGDTAIVTIEMPAEQYKTRWFCELSGIQYDKFREYALTKEEWKRLDRTIDRAEKHDNKMYMIDMPSSCTAQAIRAELDILKRKKSRDIKMVGIDYLNIMGNSTGDFGINWEFQVQTAIEVKMVVARGLNIPTWSVAQSTEQDKTAFSRHINDQVDVAIMLTPTPDYEETGMLRITYPKVRDFKGVPAIIYTDREHMKLVKKVSKEEKRRAQKLKKISKRRIT